ncbi:MAG: sugar phosphate isomerase/epimerase family protein [Phycisphaerae bacterium]
MKRQFACRISSYGRYVEQGWSHLGELGIEHVEVLVPRSEEEKARLRRRLADSGLSVSSFQTPCDVDCIDPGETIRPLLETCVEFDVQVAFVSVKPGPDVDFATACQRLRYIGDVAAGLGIAVTIEIHPPLATNGSTALRTMQQVGHPNIRINYDTGNIYFYNRRLNAVDELAKVVDYVASVHLKDTSGKYRKWQFPALGRGVVDFEGVFSLLDRREFLGPYTLELEGIQGKRYSLEGRLAYVARSVEYLRSIGVLD